MRVTEQFVTASGAVPVCQPAKDGVTNAEKQRRYRQGAAYQALLARKREQRRLRREKWYIARRKYKTMANDGRESGAHNEVGLLTAFGTRDPELRGI
jgi:hypothetical protein